jgi:hypothetical protein
LGRFVAPLIELRIQPEVSGRVSVWRSGYLQLGVLICVKLFGGRTGVYGIGMLERHSSENEWFERF